MDHRGIWPFGRAGRGWKLALLGLLLLIATACQEDISTNPSGNGGVPVTAPRIQPTIVNVFRHDSLSFTQGLLYHQNFLYESSGLYGQSSLRKVRPDDGVVVERVALENRYFGEGLARYGERLVQLTWTSQIALVYRLADLALVDTFRYAGEGWGLTADSLNFIMSNGSGALFFRNDQFEVIRTVPVTLDGAGVSNLNELEFARNRIYANVWKRDLIYEIDPADGQVVRVIDCAELVDLENPRAPNDVLNGIAYHPGRGTFFLTGKRWKRLFEVRIE